MSSGYFEYFNLSGMGDEIGESAKIMTDTGVILYCHAKCDPVEVRHRCAIARLNVGYPVEITLWQGPEDAKFLAWSARIYWRESK